MKRQSWTRTVSPAAGLRLPRAARLRRTLVAGSLLTLLAIGMPGCKSTGSGAEGEKFHWPWKKQTVPSAPAPSGGARARGAGGPDPFLPSLAPTSAADRQLPPPDPGQDTGSSRPLIDEATADSRAPRAIELVSNSRGAAADSGLDHFTTNVNAVVKPMARARAYRYIVVHQSKSRNGSLKVIDRIHRQALGWEGCGYHFVIGNGNGSPDGAIETADRWILQKPGAHLPKAPDSEYNQDGIGICLVGDFAGERPTHQQIRATRSLVQYLARVYRIPSENILSSNELVEPGGTAEQSLFRIDDVLPTGR